MYHQITKILLIAGLFFAIPQIAQAGFLDEIAYCTKRGNCGFDDIAIALSSVIKLLLGSMGAVALVYFVWGGIQWLISGGNAERVQRGKQIMINTIMAIILAFGSYLIVSFFVNDILNARYDDNVNFRIQEGSFVESCAGKPAGAPCGESGDNKQCTGEIPEGSLGAEWSNKCLYNCQIQILVANDYTKSAECVSELPEGWFKILDSPNLCPSGKMCAFEL